MRLPVVECGAKGCAFYLPNKRFKGVLLPSKYGILCSTENKSDFGQEVSCMKGYNTSDGYMGLVDGRYVLFASEADYREYMEE